MPVKTQTPELSALEKEDAYYEGIIKQDIDNVTRQAFSGEIEKVEADLGRISVITSGGEKYFFSNYIKIIKDKKVVEIEELKSGMRVSFDMNVQNSSYINDTNLMIIHTEKDFSNTQQPTDTALPEKNDETADTLSGDINNDKKVDLTDAKLVLRMALGIDIVTKNNITLFSAADCNEDCTIDLEDAKEVLRMALGVKIYK